MKALLFWKKLKLQKAHLGKKMFPYIRSYISIITTQPGMAPIVLPAMNIIAMINDQKNKN